MYIPELTERLSKQIRKHAPDLGLALRPPEKVSKIFTDMKQKLRPGQCSCVVYGIPCEMCPKWYYGETTWTIDRVEDENKKNLRYIRKNNKKKQNTKHHFDFDNKKVMKQVRSKRTLKIHEANQFLLNEHLAVNFK